MLIKARGKEDAWSATVLLREGKRAIRGGLRVYKQFEVEKVTQQKIKIWGSAHGEA